MAQFVFTIKVVGEGNDEQEAWNDAKQSADEKVFDGNYDLSEPITNEHVPDWEGDEDDDFDDDDE